MREMARAAKEVMRSPWKKLQTLAKYLESDGEVKDLIKKEMTEDECRRAVQRISKGAIARRARFIYEANKAMDHPCRPKDALAIARIEYREQVGGFR